MIEELEESIKSMTAGQAQMALLSILVKVKNLKTVDKYDVEDSVSVGLSWPKKD
jgi:hypothetical protein